MKGFKNILSNQSGAAAYILSVLIAGVGVGVGYMLEQEKNVQKNVVKEVQRSEGKILLDKATTLAHSLVSSNTIICKSKPFTGSNLKNSCIFSGYQYSAGSIVNVTESQLGLASKGFNENGFHVFDLDTSKISIPEDLEGADYKLAQATGQIAFRLYDLNDDYLGLASSLGGIPIESAAVDGERAVVLAKVTIKYGEKYKLSSSLDADGNRVQKRTKTPGFQLTKNIGFRRPTPQLSLSIGDTVCKTGCRPSVNLDNNPDCRSAQDFKNTDEVSVTGKVTNIGSGAILALGFARVVELNPTLFPNVPQPAPEVIDVLASAGKDYLLPGETLSFEDTVPCFTFNTVQNQNVYMSNARTDANGNPLCFSSQPFTDANIIPCPGSSSSGISQHTQTGGKIKYKLDVGLVATENASQKKLKEIFGNRSVIPFGFQIPSQYQNKSESFMEPAVLMTVINEVGDVPAQENVISNVNIIATH